jgi:transposase
MKRQHRFQISEEERTGLETLARSPKRAEADRARAVLRYADGEATSTIAKTLGVREDRVRYWRMVFRRHGVEALCSRPKTGRKPLKTEVALPVVKEILGEPAPSGVVWTVPRLSEEVARRSGMKISVPWLGVVMKVKGGCGGRGRGTRSRAGRMWMPSSGRDCG